jgi:hypothetical protein
MFSRVAVVVCRNCFDCIIAADLQLWEKEQALHNHRETTQKHTHTQIST